MKSTPKWLLIPPVVAAMLVLGPLSMRSDGDPSETTRAAAEPAPAEPAPRRADDKPRRGERSANAPTLPRTPDMWQMTSALIGVLLLGGGGLLLLKKLRGGASPRGGQTLATLRQTIRLSAKQAVHAIEFDNRILLVGEGDKGLSLIDRGSLPESVEDEAVVLRRALEQATAAEQAEAEKDEEDEAGATPRNLLIPRPTAPTHTGAAPRGGQQTRLGDFRALLEKAGR